MSILYIYNIIDAHTSSSVYIQHIGIQISNIKYMYTFGVIQRIYAS